MTVLESRKFLDKFVNNFIIGVYGSSILHGEALNSTEATLARATSLLRLIQLSYMSQEQTFCGFYRGNNCHNEQVIERFRYCFVF